VILSVPEKTNEITAIPELLDQPAEAGQLEGALLPIDAIGCPVEMASKIVEQSRFSAAATLLHGGPL
jgi:predicted transposase YbfD/YdcC